jgi:hypothetical protein
MTVQVLLVSLKFNIPPAEYTQIIKPLVEDILNTPGLRWKIWLINESQCTAGGIYLFDNSSDVQEFLVSPLMNSLGHHPAFVNFCVMPFDVLDAETAITHGPIWKGVRV